MANLQKLTRQSRMTFSLLLSLLIINSNVISAEKPSESTQVSQKLCGPYSLSIVCKMLGIKADINEISRLAKTTEKGTSMKGLADTAYQLGLKARGMKISLEQLLKLKMPVIAFVKNNHFLVIERVINQQLRVIEYNREPYLILVSEFSKIWKGHVLVVSPQKKIEGPQPDIQIDNPVYDAGFVEQQSYMRHVFVIKNVGEQPLIITEKPSCNCTAAVLSGNTIIPGEQVQLEVLYATRDDWAEQTITVTIHSNDPDEAMTMVTMKGYVISRFIPVIPNVIRLGDIDGKKEVLRKIEVYDPGYKKLEVKKVETSSDKIEAKFISNEKGKKAEIQVRIKPGLPLGEVQEQITIYTNDDKTPELIVPVLGKVGLITIFPPRFFFGFVQRGKTASQSITLTKQGEGNLEIIQIESPLKEVQAEIVPVKKAQKYTVKLTFTAGKQTPNIVKSTVRIHTNQSEYPPIEIPLYAVVQ